LHQNQCALIIDISNELPKPPKLAATIAHEMFHLYEYGYTMFKVGWLTEGMSVWAESLVRPQTAKVFSLPSLPQNDIEIQEEIFKQNYTASRFFNRLAQLYPSQNELPKNLLEKTYSDGTPVIKSQQLIGSTLMISILEKLGETDKKISLTNQWEPFAWPERDQRSDRYNSLILDTIKQCIPRINTQQPNEVSYFKNAGNQPNIQKKKITP
jgi:hypothetical protein